MVTETASNLPTEGFTRFVDFVNKCKARFY